MQGWDLISESLDDAIQDPDRVWHVELLVLQCSRNTDITNVSAVLLLTQTSETLTPSQ
jgi:hypothetical protein